MLCHARCAVLGFALLCFALFLHCFPALKSRRSETRNQRTRNPHPSIGELRNRHREGESGWEARSGRTAESETLATQNLHPGPPGKPVRTLPEKGFGSLLGRDLRKILDRKKQPVRCFATRPTICCTLLCCLLCFALFLCCFAVPRKRVRTRNQQRNPRPPTGQW